MADQNKSNGGELERPKGVADKSGGAKQPEVFVMPKEFYGAPVGPAKLTPPETKPLVEPPSTPKPPQPVPAPQKKPVVKSGKSFPLVVLALVVIIILALGTAAYFLFFRDVSECGNSMCERGESYASCPADCEPPPPVCGNDSCENGESYLSCPTDCPQPEVVCGDGNCNGEENAESCPSDCAEVPVCGDGECAEGETAGSCPGDCRVIEPVPATDTDSDGISDIEETSIYGSDPNRANSDGDSFVDLNEILNLFDPSSPEPARLVDNPGIDTYRDAGKGLELLYPSRWSASDGQDSRSILFLTGTGESVQATLYTKDSQTTLAEWIGQASVPGLPVGSRFERSINRRGYEQATVSDRRTAVVTDGTHVVLLRYELNGQTEVRYRVTLAMMSNSLVFLEIATPPGGEEGSVLPLSDQTGGQ